MPNIIKYCGVCNSFVEHNIIPSLGVHWFECLKCNFEPQAQKDVETKTDILYSLNTLHKIIEYRKSVI